MAGELENEMKRMCLFSSQNTDNWLLHQIVKQYRYVRHTPWEREWNGESGQAVDGTSKTTSIVAQSQFSLKTIFTLRCHSKRYTAYADVVRRQNERKNSEMLYFLCTIRFYIHILTSVFCLFMSNLRTNVPRNGTKLKQKITQKQNTIFETFNSPNRPLYYMPIDLLFTVKSWILLISKQHYNIITILHNNGQQKFQINYYRMYSLRYVHIFFWKKIWLKEKKSQLLKRKRAKKLLAMLT